MMNLHNVQTPSCEVVLSHPDGTKSSFSLTMEEAHDLASLHPKAALPSTSKALSAIKIRLEQDKEAVRKATWTFDGSATLVEEGQPIASFNLFDGKEASALFRYIAERGSWVFLENRPQGQVIAHIKSSHPRIPSPAEFQATA